MINLQELRIGNNIIANYMREGQEMVEVQEIFPIGVRVKGKKWTWNEEVFETDIQPFPLSENALLSYGFKMYLPESSSGNYYLLDGIDRFISCEGKTGLYTSALVYKENARNNPYELIAKVENIHQLQNIYFENAGIFLTCGKG